MEVIPVEAQPLGAAVQRILAALDYLGQPLDAGSAAAVNAALGDTNELSAITAIQNALDPPLPRCDQHRPGRPRQAAGGACEATAGRGRLDRLSGQSPQ